jgi:hypothetical protein
MDITGKELSDGELENYFSNVDIFPDKPKKNIDWAALIPQKAESNPTENAESAEFINPINIFTKANLKLRKNTLIRNKTLKATLDSMLESKPEVMETNNDKPEVVPPTQMTNLGYMIKRNRKELGMSQNVPNRPFMVPNIINGPLSHKITQFILHKK